MNPPGSDASDDDDRTVIRPASRTVATPRDVPAATAEHGNALPVGVRLGEFELTQVIGEGGFGIVYLAQDHSLQRRVALKEYMPSALAARTGPTQVAVKSERHRDTFELGLKSFVNEARLLAQFDHPALVKVYRFWEANGTAYMVMPFYEGITLKDKLRELGSPPDEAWLMALLAPLTEALSVIHAEHCYHRDIAPDNIILLAGSGKPLLLDFGAARRVIGDMTHALTVILKPGYAPLEQYAEVPSMKQGPWTDVYALAAVVYFAITGKTPPPSVGRIMSDSYVPLAESARGRYSDRFLQAIDRGLQVRPEDRTPSIAALRQAIGLVSHEAPPYDTRPVTFLDPVPSRAAVAPKATGGAPAASTTRRSGTAWWIAGGLLALVAIGVGAFFGLTSGSKPPEPRAVVRSEAAPVPAPAPAVTAAPAAASPAPFSVGTEFDRIVAAASPQFAVDATPAKPQFRIDHDKLAFKVTSARDGHVYVLLHQSDDSVVLLFPNSAAKQNRIRAGQTLNLPQASWPLVTADPPGPQRFLVMVSQAPRDFDAISQGRDSWFMKLPTGDVGSRLAAALGGRGSVLAGKAECQGDGCDAYGAARFTVDVVR